VTIRIAPVPVLAALAATLLVAGCGASVVSGHGSAQAVQSPGGPSGFPASSSAGPPSSGPSTSSSSSASGRLTAPDSDFSVALPAGWTDATDKAASFGAVTAYLGPSDNGFATNVNVVRQQIGSVGVDQYANGTQQGVKSIGATSVTDPAPLTIDGEDALEYSFSDKQAGRSLKQRQTVVVHNDVGYVITYTALPDAYDASRADADALIASWQWS
jgi:hypothetical protein